MISSSREEGGQGPPKAAPGGPGGWGRREAASGHGISLR